MSNDCKRLGDVRCGDVGDSRDSVYVNESLPDWSKLKRFYKCATVEKALSDLYNQTGKLRDKMSLDGIERCVTGATSDMGIKDLLILTQTKVCELNSRFALLLASYNNLPDCDCNTNGVEECY